jgi:hypothetical protein
VSSSEQHCVYSHNFGLNLDAHILTDNFKASREEIRSAIEFLKCDDGKITISGLKNRLQILFPGLTAKEYR